MATTGAGVVLQSLVQSPTFADDLAQVVAPNAVGLGEPISVGLTGSDPCPDLGDFFVRELGVRMPLATADTFWKSARPMLFARRQCSVLSRVLQIVSISSDPEVCWVDTGSVRFAGTAVTNEQTSWDWSVDQLPREAVRSDGSTGTVDQAIARGAQRPGPKPALDLRASVHIPLKTFFGGYSTAPALDRAGEATELALANAEGGETWEEVSTALETGVGNRSTLMLHRDDLHRGATPEAVPAALGHLRVHCSREAA
jgi:hypothetical protein